jgi:hypothetical protein
MGILPMSGFPNAIYRVWGPSRRAILALRSRARGVPQTHSFAFGGPRRPRILMGGTPMLLAVRGTVA